MYRSRFSDALEILASSSPQSEISRIDHRVKEVEVLFQIFDLPRFYSWRWTAADGSWTCLGNPEMPYPKSMKEVRAFFGTARWYRRFVKNFATLSAPLDGSSRTSLR